MRDDDGEYHIPLTDEVDHEILMHRDAHFSGNFQEMLDYYENEGKGMGREILYDRILDLFEMEKELGRDLSAVSLSEEDKRQVHEARAAYLGLRDIYGKATEIEKKLADLILSEEEDPEDEVAAVTAFGDEAVPILINLVDSEKFYSELFPGYGYAPALAARCLGILGNSVAILPLFNALKARHFDVEEELLLALSRIGEPAKKFLLKVMHQLPISRENERAVMALVSAFNTEGEIAKGCLEMLQNEDVARDEGLVTYLILGCSSLTSESDRKTFSGLCDKYPQLAHLKGETEAISSMWNRL